MKLVLATALWLATAQAHAQDSSAAGSLIHFASAAQARASLYELVGFTEVGELDWPAEWAETRLANPDAPRNRHAMAWNAEGRVINVMPVLVAGRTDLKPGSNTCAPSSPRT